METDEENTSKKTNNMRKKFSFSCIDHKMCEQAVSKLRDDFPDLYEYCLYKDPSRREATYCVLLKFNSKHRIHQITEKFKKYKLENRRYPENEEIKGLKKIQIFSSGEKLPNKPSKVSILTKENQELKKKVEELTYQLEMVTRRNKELESSTDKPLTKNNTPIEAEEIKTTINISLLLEENEGPTLTIKKNQISSELKTDPAFIPSSDSYKFYLNSARELVEQGREWEAEGQYRKANNELNSQSYEIHIEWARVLVALKQTKLAHKKYKKAAELYSGNYLLYLEWARVLNGLQKIKKAEEKYQKASEITSDSFEVYFEWGNLLNELENFPNAENRYRKAAGINPNHFELHLKWARLLVILRKNDEAEDVFDRASQINDKSYEVYFEWAKFLVSCDKSKIAITKFKKASEINPKSFEVYLGWARVLVELGDEEEAMYQYHRASEINPDDFDMNMEWAKLLTKSGMFDEALRRYKKAKSNINPYHPQLQAILIELSLKIEKLEAERKQVQEESPCLDDLYGSPFMSDNDQVWAKSHLEDII